MRLVVFSDRRDVRSRFAALAGDRPPALRPVDELRKKPDRLRSCDFVYVDVSSLSADQVDEIVRLLSDACGNRFGIIDPEGSVSDPGSLFHRGAADYIGPGVPVGGIPDERLASALSYAGRRSGAVTSRAGVHAGLLLSGGGWSDVIQGEEYTFFLMYTELDGYEELKDRQGEGQVRKLLSVHRRYIETTTGQVEGKLWMWNENGGIILFPFDGTGFEPVISCMRLMLGKKIFNVEMIGSTVFHSYRIALHLGNTVFRRMGETGKIVSDAVNYIFHFGQRFTEPGSLYITGEVHALLPDCLKREFRSAGRYEGRTAFKFHLPANL